MYLWLSKIISEIYNFNLLKPNVNYSGRTAPLTSKVAFYIFIKKIYVPNILNVVYTLRFFSLKCSFFHNSNVFGSCVIHILYTGCAKIKKNNSGAKRLILNTPVIRTFRIYMSEDVRVCGDFSKQNVREQNYFGISSLGHLC